MALVPVDETRRLAFVKHLLSAALDRTKLPEPFCAAAILGLHDAVELFVHLLAEHVGATIGKKADFLAYWPLLKPHLSSDLPQHAAMKRLNQARVGLKHSGITPSRDEVTDLATRTVSFFDDASLLVFGTPFVSLSPINLVSYQPAASRLRRAETLAAEGAYDQAATLCAIAFDEVLDLFLSQHHDQGSHSPFPHLSDAKHFRSAFLGLDWKENNRELHRHLETVSGAFADIEPVLMMLALGLEYRQFVRFRRIVPEVSGMMDQSRTVAAPANDIVEADIFFAVDFVTQAALRFREIEPVPEPVDIREHRFSLATMFSVAMTDKAAGVDRPITGALTEIGGGFEAWIFHGEWLARVWRGEGRDAAVQYLERYRGQRIKDGAKDLSAGAGA